MVGVFSQNSLEHAVAGSTGTVLAMLLLFPLERLKTLLQVEAASSGGIWAMLLQVLREEGPLGLYRGCAPMLQTVGTSNFLYFFLFEGFKEPLALAAGRPDGEIGAYETLASSAIAGALNMVATEPLWRACVVAQTRRAPGDAGGGGLKLPETGGSVLAIVRRMWAQEGPRALWRGLGSSLWLVSNPVIQFFVYDVLKHFKVGHADIGSVDAFFLGAVAKALATIVTFPLQVAQSRLRAAQALQQGGKLGTTGPTGMVACLQDVLLEKGVRGLYFGLYPKLLQTVTQAALMFAFYEKVHAVIHRLARQEVRRLLLRRSMNP